MLVGGIFLASYVGLLGLSWLCRSGQMLRTVLAMTGCWIANSAYVVMSGDHTPWAWFACVDFATALIVLRHPAGKWQATIGWTYIAQIVLHFMYWLAGNPDAAFTYWLWLTIIAIVQIGLVVLWGGPSGVRRSHRHWVRGRPRLPFSDGVGGVGIR